MTPHNRWTIYACPDFKCDGFAWDGIDKRCPKCGLAGLDPTKVVPVSEPLRTQAVDDRIVADALRRVERLEAALREIADHAEESGTWCDHGKWARAALAASGEEE